MAVRMPMTVRRSGAPVNLDSHLSSRTDLRRRTESAGVSDGRHAEASHQLAQPLTGEPQLRRRPAAMTAGPCQRRAHVAFLEPAPSRVERRSRLARRGGRERRGQGRRTDNPPPLGGYRERGKHVLQLADVPGQS